MGEGKAAKSTKDDKKDAKIRAKTNPNHANNPRNRKKIPLDKLLPFLSMLFAAFGSIVIAMFIQQPVSWAMHTTGPLWGEIHLDSPQKARSFADLSIHEAETLWAEPASNWHTMFNSTPWAKKNELMVECRRVTQGDFKKSEVHLARAEGILRGVAAQEAFEFMVSPEGLALIDPFSSNRTDFYQSIERIPDWREGAAKAEIAEVILPGFGPFSDRHLLVLSSSIPEERIWVAKSVIHSTRPGASALYSVDKVEKDPNDQRVRSVTTFAIKVDTIRLASGEEVASLKMISYVNFLLHESIMSYASCKWLFPGIYRNFQNAFDAKRHIQPK